MAGNDNNKKVRFHIVESLQNDKHESISSSKTGEHLDDKKILDDKGSHQQSKISVHAVESSQNDEHGSISSSKTVEHFEDKKILDDKNSQQKSSTDEALSGTQVAEAVTKEHVSDISNPEKKDELDNTNSTDVQENKAGIDKLLHNVYSWASKKIKGNGSYGIVTVAGFAVLAFTVIFVVYKVPSYLALRFIGPEAAKNVSNFLFFALFVFVLIVGLGVIHKFYNDALKSAGDFVTNSLAETKGHLHEIVSTGIQDGISGFLNSAGDIGNRLFNIVDMIKREFQAYLFRPDVTPELLVNSVESLCKEFASLTNDKISGFIREHSKTLSAAEHCRLKKLNLEAEYNNDVLNSINALKADILQKKLISKSYNGGILDRLEFLQSKLSTSSDQKEKESVVKEMHSCKLEIISILQGRIKDIFNQHAMSSYSAFAVKLSDNGFLKKEEVEPLQKELQKSIPSEIDAMLYKGFEFLRTPSISNDLVERVQNLTNEMIHKAGISRIDEYGLPYVDSLKDKINELFSSNKSLKSNLLSFVENFFKDMESEQIKASIKSFKSQIIDHINKIIQDTYDVELKELLSKFKIFVEQPGPLLQNQALSVVKQSVKEAKEQIGALISEKKEEITIAARERVDEVIDKTTEALGITPAFVYSPKLLEDLKSKVQGMKNHTDLKGNLLGIVSEYQGSKDSKIVRQQFISRFGSELGKCTSNDEGIVSLRKKFEEISKNNVERSVNAFIEKARAESSVVVSHTIEKARKDLVGLAGETGLMPPFYNLRGNKTLQDELKRLVKCLQSHDGISDIMHIKEKLLDILTAVNDGSKNCNAADFINKFRLALSGCKNEISKDSYKALSGFFENNARITTLTDIDKMLVKKAKWVDDKVTQVDELVSNKVEEVKKIKQCVFNKTNEVMNWADDFVSKVGLTQPLSNLIGSKKLQDQFKSLIKGLQPCNDELDIEDIRNNFYDILEEFDTSKDCGAFIDNFKLVLLGCKGKVSNDSHEALSDFFGGVSRAQFMVDFDDLIKVKTKWFDGKFEEVKAMKECILNKTNELKEWANDKSEEFKLLTIKVKDQIQQLGLSMKFIYNDDFTPNLKQQIENIHLDANEKKQLIETFKIEEPSKFASAFKGALYRVIKEYEQKLSDDSQNYNIKDKLHALRKLKVYFDDQTELLIKEEIQGFSQDLIKNVKHDFEEMLKKTKLVSAHVGNVEGFKAALLKSIPENDNRFDELKGLINNCNNENLTKAVDDIRKVRCEIQGEVKDLTAFDDCLEKWTGLEILSDIKVILSEAENSVNNTIKELGLGSPSCYKDYEGFKSRLLEKNRELNRLLQEGVSLVEEASSSSMQSNFTMPNSNSDAVEKLLLDVVKNIEEVLEKSHSEEYNSTDGTSIILRELKNQVSELRNVEIEDMQIKQAVNEIIICFDALTQRELIAGAHNSLRELVEEVNLQASSFVNGTLDQVSQQLIKLDILPIPEEEYQKELQSKFKCFIEELKALHLDMQGFSAVSLDISIDHRDGFVEEFKQILRSLPNKSGQEKAGAESVNEVNFYGDTIDLSKIDLRLSMEKIYNFLVDNASIVSDKDELLNSFSEFYNYSATNTSPVIVNSVRDIVSNLNSEIINAPLIASEFIIHPQESITKIQECLDSLLNSLNESHLLYKKKSFAIFGKSSDASSSDDLTLQNSNVSPMQAYIGIFEVLKSKLDALSRRLKVIQAIEGFGRGYGKIHVITEEILNLIHQELYGLSRDFDNKKTSLSEKQKQYIQDKILLCHNSIDFIFQSGILKQTKSAISGLKSGLNGFLYTPPTVIPKPEVNVSTTQAAFPPSPAPSASSTITGAVFTSPDSGGNLAALPLVVESNSGEMGQDSLGVVNEFTGSKNATPESTPEISRKAVASSSNSSSEARMVDVVSISKNKTTEKGSEAVEHLPTAGTQNLSGLSRISSAGTVSTSSVDGRAESIKVNRGNQGKKNHPRSTSRPKSSESTVNRVEETRAVASGSKGAKRSKISPTGKLSYTPGIDSGLNSFKNSGNQYSATSSYKVSPEEARLNSASVSSVHQDNVQVGTKDGSLSNVSSTVLSTTSSSSLPNSTAASANFVAGSKKGGKEVVANTTLLDMALKMDPTLLNRDVENGKTLVKENAENSKSSPNVDTSIEGGSASSSEPSCSRAK